MRRQLPYEKMVNAAAGLYERFGRWRWFTVPEAALVMDPEAVVDRTRKGLLRRKLERLVDRGLLVGVDYPPRIREPAERTFSFTVEGSKVVEFYRRYGEEQRDLGEVLDCL